MADLTITQVKGGLKIVSENSTIIINEYSTKINSNNSNEIEIVSDINNNYSQVKINFANYETVYFEGNAIANASDLQRALSLTTQKIDVAVQDQTTKAVIVKFNRVTNSTTLADSASRGDTSIVVTSSTGISVGSYIILFNPTSTNFMFATAVNIASAPTIVIDTPLDNDFAAGTYVDIAVTNMKSIGSLASPITFGLRGTGAPPGVNITVDITRIIITAVGSSAFNLSTFMNLAKLTNGLVLRKRNDDYENIFNVKDNREIASLMYDVTISASTNPVQGEDGLIGRLTFAGQEKIGVAIRLPVGEDLEFLVQDDISTAQAGESITTLEIIAEGHIVE